jgi:putative transposase
LVWAVVVTAASVQDREGAKRLLPLLEPNSQRLQTLYADGAYAGQLEDLCAYFYEWHLQIVKKLDGQKGFVVLPKRWIVERTLAWLSRYRRLSKDYEFQPQSSQAMIQWASIRRMLRCLTKPDT